MDVVQSMRRTHDSISYLFDTHDSESIGHIEISRKLQPLFLEENHPQSLSVDAEAFCLERGSWLVFNLLTYVLDEWENLLPDAL